MAPEAVRPYMLAMPRHPELVVAWEEYWVKFILDLAEEESLSLVSVLELRRREPFNEMDEASFRAALEALVKRGYAKWWDKRKGILRIYWCSPEHWMRKLSEAIAARSTPVPIVEGVGGAIELVPEMASLPKEEVEEVLELMVKNGLAEWVDKRRKALRIASPR